MHGAKTQMDRWRDQEGSRWLRRRHRRGRREELCVRAPARRRGPPEREDWRRRGPREPRLGRRPGCRGRWGAGLDTHSGRQAPSSARGAGRWREGQRRCLPGPSLPRAFLVGTRGGPGGRRAVAAGGSARPWVPASARGRPRRHADFTSAPGNSCEVGVVSLSQMRDAARCPGHRMERAPGRKQRGRVST